MSLIAYRYCLPAILFGCLSTKGPFMEKTHTRLTVIGTKQLGQVPCSALEAMSCLSIPYHPCMVPVYLPTFGCF